MDMIKFNKWCDTEGIDYLDPEKGMSLLFKYAVPKLIERNCEIALTRYPDEDHWNGCLWTNVEPFIDINEESSDPVQALYKAITKLIQEA
ncbi:hypothetical protein LCGC14_1145840 [marine sediment metagenome]|uniref:Uncharacterized protein n=1 Tax=marine sediment metagenome TaxID=412755 RepID=A0A0F9PF13_9ZZZZ